MGIRRSFRPPSTPGTSMIRSTLATALLHLLLALPLAAQGGCTGPDHRAFDFWIGSWEVYDTTGVRRGTNQIRSILGGCVIHESYSTTGGYAGQSLNIYDASRGVWHQSWVDNAGLLLLIEGGIRDGDMVLEGTTRGADGGETRNRITWSLMDATGDRVRQLWEISADGGSTWTVAFDGEYRRRPA